MDTMSATTTLGTAESESSGSLGGNAPVWLRVYFLGFSLPVVGVILLLAPSAWRQSSLSWTDLCAWLFVVVAADLAPVPVWHSVTLSMSLPVTLAAGMLYPPPIAGLIAFSGSLDRREFRGEVPIDRALYNRSQVALSVCAASLVFHWADVSVQDWPTVLVAATLALTLDFVLNSMLVAFPLRILVQVTFASALRNMIGSPSVRQHLISYICVGVLAVTMAAVVTVAGSWGVFVFLAPLFIARRELLHASSLEDSARKIQEKNTALLAAVERVADERRDERLAVAGELHDEILPPLFKVHLMGQVLRRDLDSGRLLNLDEDLPELLSATDAAQDAIRSLVGELRRSPLGPGGLVPTLKLLLQQLEHESDARLNLVASDVECSPITQLLVYQIAREALTNAVRHSQAGTISLRLWQEGAAVHLMVEDDGIGFTPGIKQGHFGLQMIAERAEAAQGNVVVDSTPGVGTRIVATVPSKVR
jgi:signal transduction histidine kinase